MMPSPSKSAPPMVSTYSMWSLFRNCRKAADWRYLKELVTLEKDKHLSFGALIHQCLGLGVDRRPVATAMEESETTAPPDGWSCRPMRRSRAPT